MKLILGIIIACVLIAVCYHYIPTATESVLVSVGDRSVEIGKDVGIKINDKVLDFVDNVTNINETNN